MSGKGMAYLSKKSWNTSNLKQVQKVWEAEEKQRKENAALLQRHRELEEERRIDEIRQLQIQRGLVVEPKQERLDWMYAGEAVNKSTDDEIFKSKKQMRLINGQKNDTTATTKPNSMNTNANTNDNMKKNEEKKPIDFTQNNKSLSFVKNSRFNKSNLISYNNICTTNYTLDNLIKEEMMNKHHNNTVTKLDTSTNNSSSSVNIDIAPHLIDAPKSSSSCATNNSTTAPTRRKRSRWDVGPIQT